MRAKITIGCFLTLLTLFFITVVILPKDEKAAVLENRTLQEFPELTAETLFSGQFTSQFESYLSDNVGFRSVWTDLSARFEDSKGIHTFGKLVQTTGDLGVGQTTENQLLVIEDRVMEVYQKDPQMQKKYVDMVNYYAESLPEDINLYNMLIPTQIAFMEEYSGLGDDEIESINQFYSSYLPRVKTIDVSDTLREQFLDGKYVYFRTDHHWTTLGAYYAYQTMADAMDMPKLDLGDFWIGDEAPFLGHLYTQSKTPRLQEHADTIYYYVNDMNNIPVDPVTYSYIPGQRVEYEGKMFCPEEGARYELFLAGDHPFIEIDSASENDRTLLLIKDSYSNALLPWLTCGYNQILVVDARTFDQTIDDLLQQYDVDDVLIANYIMGTNFEDYIDLCTDIYEARPVSSDEEQADESAEDHSLENDTPQENE